MITRIPRAAESDRGPDGLPKGMESESEWPCNWTQINGGPGTQPLTAKVDNRNSGNVNHHLPWLMFAAILGAIGTTLGVVTLVLALTVGPRYLEALAQSKSERAVALSELARKEASTAKDLVDKDRAKAKALEEIKNERR